MKLRSKATGILTIVILFSILSVKASNEFPITRNTNSQSDPAIYEDIVVWVDYRNDYSDIYGYSLSADREFRITTDSGHQSSPTIYRNTVVWVDEGYAENDIFGATFQR